MYNVEIVIEPASQIRAEAVQMLSKAFGKKPDPDIWQWKHENNPFGQSRVIVARKKNQIVGLRPIWVSPIIYANKQIDAVQFVDSAVIETERGKGLFRDMCAQALGEIKDSLVFHTPNQMSYPAYMKMGWCNVGGLVRCWQPLSISAILKYLMKKYHFSSIKSDGNISEKLEDYSAVHESLPEGVEGLLAATAISLGNQVGIQRSMAWIKWRTGLPDGTRFFY